MQDPAQKHQKIEVPLENFLCFSICGASAAGLKRSG
jgi:hypothetical protein